ncbi:MAG TPA: hypothetical protein VF171_04540 [Trueperaceae bacterium]
MDTARMDVTLVPLLGALHLRFPAYNAISVRDSAAAWNPEALAVTPLEPDALATLDWQDTPEIALPLAVVPWAHRRGLPLVGVHVPSPDPSALEDFRRYLGAYPEQRHLLQEADAALGPVRELLAEPLDLPRVLSELLPALRAHAELQEARLGEGPATDWLRTRAEQMAARILALPQSRVAVLAAAEHIPLLEDALAERAHLTPPPLPPISEEAARRALLDVAFRGETDEPGPLIARLRDLEDAEARYHEANLLLAHDHAAEALELLENTVRGDFSHPYYLPGYLLARLGQLYDLAGERERALRSYRGTLALDWAPAAAREAAEAGLAEPFGATQETSEDRASPQQDQAG